MKLEQRRLFRLRHFPGEHSLYFPTSKHCGAFTKPGAACLGIVNAQAGALSDNRWRRGAVLARTIITTIYDTSTFLNPWWPNRCAERPPSPRLRPEPPRLSRRRPDSAFAAQLQRYELVGGITTMPRAVVLAGGKGTRLRPYTAVLPKPLLPIGDRPVLDIVVRQLGGAGFEHVTIATGYMVN